VYIHLICLLFNSPTKGKHLLKSESLKKFVDILPRQNIQQTNQQTSQQLFLIAESVAEDLTKHLPFYEREIKPGLHELLVNNILYLEGEYLCQKRMIKDVQTSASRSNNGKKGAAATNKKKKEKPDSESSAPPPAEVFDEILPQQNNQQKEQQKPNYNYNYNYNSIEESIGVSNSTGGGMGETEFGGKGEEMEVVDVLVNYPDARIKLGRLDLQMLNKNSEDFREAWIDWLTFLTEKRKCEITSSTREKSLHELIRFANFDEYLAIKIINQSITRGWTSFQKIETEKTNPKPFDKKTKPVVMSGNAPIEEQIDHYKRKKRD